MTNFRILQTQLLSEPLPYEVEELTQKWYHMWPVWCSVREEFVQLFTFWPAIKRFQTPRAAGLYIERVLAARARHQAAQNIQHAGRLKPQQRPRTGAEFGTTILG